MTGRPVGEGLACAAAVGHAHAAVAQIAAGLGAPEQ